VARGNENPSIIWLAKDFRVFLIAMLFLVFSLSVANFNIVNVEFFGKYKWVMLAVVVGYSVMCFFMPRKKARSVYHPLLQVLLGFFVVELAFTTILHANSFQEASLRALSFALLYLISVGFPVFSKGQDDGLRLVLSILIVSLIYVFGSLLLLTKSYSFASGRLFGLAGHPNTLGTMAMISCVCGYGLMNHQHSMDSKPTRIFVYSVIVSSVAVLFLTQSRSSGMALVGAIYFMMLVLRKYMLIVLVSLVMFLGFVGIEYIYEIATGGELGGYFIKRGIQSSSLEDREYIWMEQLQRFYISPLIGLGMEMNEQAIDRRRGGESSFFDLLSAIGLAGFLPYMAALCLCLAVGYSKIKIMLRQKNKVQAVEKTSELSALVVCLGLVAGIAINSIGEGYLAQVGSMPSLVYWFAMGYCTLNKAK